MTNHHLEFFIQLHLTERCNLRCKHCYQTGKQVDEMSFSELKDTVNEISDTLKEWKELYDIDYSSSFNVTGGEPFLRNDLFNILAEIRYRGFDIYLLTNGILIDKKRAQALNHLGVKGVQVSIEGNEKVHESIRGRGSFQGSMKGIRNLLDAGLDVTLNVTLSSVNADYFTDLIELSLNLGVHRIGFSRLVPSGRGIAMIKEMLSKERVKDLYEKIFSLDTGKLEIVTGDPVAAQMNNPPLPPFSKDETGRFVNTKRNRNESVNDKGNIPLGGCAAGVSGLTIMPDGTLVPCRRLHIPLGNIRRDSFREVWAVSEVLEAIRNRSRYTGKCGNCRRWANCRGCRAIAYAFSNAKGANDFLAEDPQCFIN